MTRRVEKKFFGTLIIRIIPLKNFGQSDDYVKFNTNCKNGGKFKFGFDYEIKIVVQLRDQQLILNYKSIPSLNIWF